MLSGPMRSRFGLTHNLEFYSQEDLLHILRRNARLLNLRGTGSDPAGGAGTVDDMAASMVNSLEIIASRSRGTPRIANRLLRRVRDFCQVRAKGHLTPEIADVSLRLEGVDDLGLDELDRKYLGVVAQIYQGGPVGLEAIAATLNEDTGTLEELVEPYLLQIGFLARTRKGRQLTSKAAGHLGVRLADADKAMGLFGDSEVRS